MLTQDTPSAPLHPARWIPAAVVAVVAACTLATGLPFIGGVWLLVAVALAAGVLRARRRGASGVMYAAVAAAVVLLAIAVATRRG